MVLTKRQLLATGLLGTFMPGASIAAVPDYRDFADLRDRAKALHDRIRDEIQFGWSSNFYDEAPAETEAGGTGYCITKGALLVRDLRANGIPARLVFAEIDAGVLRGLIDPGTPMVDHAIVEADLPGGRLRFDSHIVDCPLFQAASKKLTTEGASFGYGICAAGSAEFGQFSQLVEGVVPGRIWGAFETVAEFHANAPRVWNRLPLLARLAFGFFADAANARIDALRNSGVQS
ncbi:MAG: transglutaminase-like domain-containing protein [Pseudomonadota bacterium]